MLVSVCSVVVSGFNTNVWLSVLSYICQYPAISLVLSMEYLSVSTLLSRFSDTVARFPTLNFVPELYIIEYASWIENPLCTFS